MDTTIDCEIEIDNDYVEFTDKIQLPVNYLRFGDVEDDDIRVYINQNVYKKLEEYSLSDTSKEMGSILVGEFMQDMGFIYVVVSDFIEAKYTDASASTLTFTHDTWDYVHKELDQMNPCKRIVGWQHTHPNYGIFLSNYDMFIQENYFNLPFQIAYVIDPIQNIRGFFQWKNGEVKKLRGYYVYDDVGTPVKIEQTRVKENNVEHKNRGITAIVCILCVISVLLSVLLLDTKRELSDIQNKQKNIIAQMNKSDTNDDNASKNINRPDAVGLEKYTVQKGDTLYTICVNRNIEYDDVKGIILGINGISNEDSILEGQVIILPIYE